MEYLYTNTLRWRGWELEEEGDREREMITERFMERDIAV